MQTLPTLIGFWGILCAAAGLASAAPVRAPHVQVELVSDHEAVSESSSFRLGLHFKLEKGWHLYWSNAGDSGEPPRARWSLPEGATVGDIQWPVPRRINVGPLTNFGYEDEVLLALPIQLGSSKAQPGGTELRFQADVHWLVCKEECVPGNATLNHSVLLRTASPQPDADWSVRFAASERMVPAPAPKEWKATGYRDSKVLRLSIEGVGQSAELLDFFPFEGDRVSHGTLPRSKLEGATLKIELQAADRAPVKIPRGEPIVSGVAVLSSSGGGTQAYRVQFIQSTAMGEGILFPILFAFLGGILLNLMPCVFPVLSIKALSLVKLTGSGNRRAAKSQGWAYTAGVVVSFWVLVGVLLGLRYGGRQIGWGFQLQSPGFVFVMASVLFAMALNMLGAFEIKGSWMGAGGALANRGGWVGSFFTGMLATLVATPCTAPFMGSAVGYALSQSAGIVFSVFTALALGLAFPYLLLAYMPGLGRILPKPGRWMESFKQAMAFPLFAAVLWLAWVLSLQTSASGLLLLLCSCTVIGFAAWLSSRWSRLAIPALLIGVGASLAGATQAPKLVAPVGAASAPKAGSGLQWESYTPERLTQYREKGQPIFVNFTAAWCVACQVNELNVFQDARVQVRLKELGFALLKADWTNEDPVITEALASFGRSGVPFYVIYGRGKNSPPIPLPEVITPSSVLTELEKMK